MSYKAYLDIDGTRGEVQVAGYAGQIEVLSYSFGNARLTSGGTGTSGGAGRASFDSFSITKYVDVASSDLWTKCANGKTISKMTLSIEKRQGDKLVMKVTYVFTDVYVDGMQWSPSTSKDNDSTTTESVTFKFGKLQITSFQPDDKARLQTAGGWDVVPSQPSY